MYYLTKDFTHQCLEIWESNPNKKESVLYVKTLSYPKPTNNRILNKIMQPMLNGDMYPDNYSVHIKEIGKYTICKSNDINQLISFAALESL